MPFPRDSVAGSQIEALVQKIAGPHAPSIRDLAAAIAEQIILLEQIRRVRCRFLSERLQDPSYDQPRYTQAKAKLLARVLQRHVSQTYWEAFVGWLRDIPSGPEKLMAILSGESELLRKLDRYERRALSKRKFAIRAFDAARSQRALVDAKESSGRLTEPLP